MKIEKLIYFILLLICGSACHDVVEPGGSSITKMLTSKTWVQSYFTYHDDPINEGGWVIKFNEDGTYEDAGLNVDPTLGEATWEWNDAKTQILISQDGLVVAKLNVVELGSGKFTYDKYLSFPDIQDHVVYYNIPVCANDVDWDGDYSASENYYEDGHYSKTNGPYQVTLVQDIADPNRFSFTNFADQGITAYFVFDPETSSVDFPNQDDGNGDVISGYGTYDACLSTFVIRTSYDGNEWNYVFVKE